MQKDVSSHLWMESESEFKEKSACHCYLLDLTLWNAYRNCTWMWIMSKLVLFGRKNLILVPLMIISH